MSYIENAVASGGSGTVTSVGLATGAGAADALYTISGSPVTTSGTLTETLNTQTANTVFAGPTSGAAATPTFRALTPADGSAAFLTTAGQAGGIFPAVDPSFNYTSNTTAGFPTGSVCRAMMFVVPFRITINKMTIDLSVASGTAGSHAYAGIYDAAGTTLKVQGKFAADSATVQTVSCSPSATLAPGTYWYVFGADSAAGTATCRLGLTGISSWTNLMNNNGTVRMGTCNSISGGNLPSSVGTVSALSVNVPVVFGEA